LTCCYSLHCDKSARPAKAPARGILLPRAPPGLLIALRGMRRQALVAVASAGVVAALLAARYVYGSDPRKPYDDLCEHLKLTESLQGCAYPVCCPAGVLCLEATCQRLHCLRWLGQRLVRALAGLLTAPKRIASSGARVLRVPTGLVMRRDLRAVPSHEALYVCGNQGA
jgi:hypothetical protein